VRTLRIVQGFELLVDLHDVARDYLDSVELCQAVNELAQSSDANQRIPRASLGTMMSKLEESEVSGEYKNQHPWVKAAIDAVETLEGTVPSLERLRELTKLSTYDRGFLGALLSLVAVVVGLDNKPVSTISQFPPPSDNELNNFNNTKNANDKSAKKSRLERAHDEAVISVGFRVFCPDSNYDTSSTLELVQAILPVLASDDVDSPLRDLALSVMFVVFGQRFVNDDAPWKAADSFSLFPDEESNPVPFFRGNNERRKLALQHCAILLMGKQYEDLVNATNGLVLDGTDSFQLAWLRTSVSNTKNSIPAGVRNGWMTLECFAAGSFAGDDKSINAMKKTLKMSQTRKDGSSSTRGFRGPKLILFRLDTDKPTMDGSSALIRRLRSS
jgi:hypothetical protein